MTISYMTKRGAYAARRFEPSDLADQIAAMLKRRIECRARDEDGNEVGAVWKESGQWRWYCDQAK